MNFFIGRKKELEQLSKVQQFERACLVVIKGRRRIGKSRLATEFAKGQRFLSFTGLAPLDGVTAKDQRDTFARQFASHLQVPPFTFLDWNDAFSHLSYHLRDEPTVVLLDEISWMGSKDPTFIPKLKAWWDLESHTYPNLTLILCGSVSTWIDDNIINSMAFFGRISLQITLAPLSLPECALFLDAMGFKGSTYDAFKLLAVLGGIPWYLEHILASETADANIKRLCFEEGGVLTTEFGRIFHDLFHKRGEGYTKVVRALAGGMKTLKDIQQDIKMERGGALSRIMEDLISAGFVSKHPQWSLKTGREGRKSLYRLSDEYVRFYIKYIEPHLSKIQHHENVVVSQLPGWEAMMGFQVESLLLKNRPLLIKAMGLTGSEIVMDNPYMQSSTTRQKGCQIDYLVQTHAQSLFAAEFKFRKRELGLEIIEEMQDKINRFSIPRGYGVAPVLFTLGGVSDVVHDARYFYRIIDIADFLRGSPA